ncbi:MAG TPA: HAMP domain-containing sensor histidine kinase [Alloacidobacterium sp.]|jgi:signal transduction histidine kinase|nr:HAMP domain-containing sensor histidine kinase [Alloacidobacterium sp.]
MPQKRGIRTRELLVAAMALIIASATFTSLLVVRHRLEAQVTAGLSADLLHSVITFQDLQAQRMNALERENSLLADLPSLKALMTAPDDGTIENGAVEFWKVSGNSLFALADKDNRIVAAYTGGPRADPALRDDLRAMLAVPDRHYLVSGGRLFVCSVRPLYFGSEEDGTLLGYVISGFEIGNIVEQISRATTVEATFASSGHVLASTLALSMQTELTTRPLPREAATPVTVKLAGEQFLAVTKDLSANASAPLQLIVLKSFDEAERSIRQIDHLVLIAGLLALVLGTILMMALSRVVTGPLEELATGVRAFGVGDSAHLLPHRGTMEVRELSIAFARMRNEIQQANRAVLEAERLATIGRMASSVSHDLRHYLAAVYANAEFLASARLSETERNEIFADIRTAVHGTTELLESLLTFSRTGNAIRRAPELMATVLERAMTMVRAHPDAAGVTLTAKYGDPASTMAVIDGKQIERAIYNLLLNACQSVHATTENAEVTATLEARNDGRIILEVKDNGMGVPENIRTTLFEPFVSEGKQKGSGLGLTLSHCIAAEHGGEVTLVSSWPGETIFQMSVARGFEQQDTVAGENRKIVVTE